MSQNIFPKGFVQAAVAAKNAGAERICLKCWTGFTGTRCPTCRENVGLVERLREQGVEEADVVEVQRLEGAYEIARRALEEINAQVMTDGTVSFRREG